MNSPATETRSVVVEREIALSAGKDLARAHPAAPDRGMADEERLSTRRRPPFPSSAPTGAPSTARSRRRAEQDAVLHLGGLWPRERGHLDAHADGRRGPACAWSRRASGRTSSGTIMARRPDGPVLRQPGAGPGERGMTRKSGPKTPGTANATASALIDAAHRGTGRLARRDAGPGARADQAGRPRRGRGVEVARRAGWYTTASSAPARPTRGS